MPLRRRIVLSRVELLQIILSRLYTTLDIVLIKEVHYLHQGLYIYRDILTTQSLLSICQLGVYNAYLSVCTKRMVIVRAMYLITHEFESRLML